MIEVNKWAGRKGILMFFIIAIITVLLVNEPSIIAYHPRIHRIEDVYSSVLKIHRYSFSDEIIEIDIKIIGNYFIDSNIFLKENTITTIRVEKSDFLENHIKDNDFLKLTLSGSYDSDFYYVDEIDKANIMEVSYYGYCNDDSRLLIKGIILSCIIFTFFFIINAIILLNIIIKKRINKYNFFDEIKLINKIEIIQIIPIILLSLVIIVLLYIFKQYYYLILLVLLFIFSSFYYPTKIYFFLKKPHQRKIRSLLKKMD